MTELQEYMTTGMLGAYHPGNAILRQEKGGVNTIYRDPHFGKREGCFVRERKMLIPVPFLCMVKFKRGTTSPDREIDILKDKM